MKGKKKKRNVANIVTLAIKSQDLATMGMKHRELCPRREGGVASGRKAEFPGAPPRARGALWSAG